MDRRVLITAPTIESTTALDTIQSVSIPGFSSTQSLRGPTFARACIANGGPTLILLTRSESCECWSQLHGVGRPLPKEGPARWWFGRRVAAWVDPPCGEQSEQTHQRPPTAAA